MRRFFRWINEWIPSTIYEEVVIVQVDELPEIGHTLKRGSPNLTLLLNFKNSNYCLNIIFSKYKHCFVEHNIIRKDANRELENNYIAHNSQ